MRRRQLLGVGVGMILLGGCLPFELVDPSFRETHTVQVPSSPFGVPSGTAKQTIKVGYAPAKDSKAALRVEKIGRQILTANAEIGLRPQFAIYGTEKFELFHTGTYMVHITEGLVNECRTDGQLAALLAHEFGEMVAEREALAHPKMRVGEERPPAEVVIGNGIGDRDPAQIRVAELAKYEKQKKSASRSALSLPDPENLAHRYLEKAGFNSADLEAVAPLLKKAERTYQLERQFKTAPNLTNWAPAQNRPK